MTAFWKHSAKFSEGARLVALCLLTGHLVACAGLQKKVERRQGDHVELGRSVPPRAYAWYARARYLQGMGELELAREAYAAVLADDPRSGAAYAGLGSTYCSTDHERASATFTRGLRRADEHVPIYLARGRCELAWKQPQLALKSAQLAFEREPSSTDVSALLARALEETGRPVEAARILRAERLYSRTGVSEEPTATSGRSVDEALAQGDLARAEALSLESMTRSVLAVRALALGQRAFAEELAALVVAAAPEDTVARAVLLLTRGGDLESTAPTPGLTPLAACLWAEHLRHRVDQAALFAFLGAIGPDKPVRLLQDWEGASDPLLSACARRLYRATALVEQPGARPIHEVASTSARL